MELSLADLHVIQFALKHADVAGDLMDAVNNEIEIKQLEEVSFDEDDGCAGGACKL